MPELVFDVDEAGCASCAVRVRAALEPLGEVLAVEVDEEANRAEVRLAAAPEVSEAMLNETLAAASIGSGHEYRVTAGSLRAGVA